MTNLMQSRSTAAAQRCLTACFHLSQKYNWNVCGAIFLLTVEGISGRMGGIRVSGCAARQGEIVFTCRRGMERRQSNTWLNSLSRQGVESTTCHITAR